MLALVLIAAQQATKPLPPLPRAEAAKLAEMLEDALVDPKSIAKLESAAKAWQSKYEFGSLVEALRAGPALPAGKPKPRGKGKSAEKLEEFGSVVYGFTFEFDGQRYRYGVDVPKRYDASEPAPLLVDPGHGTGAKLDARGKADFLPFYRGQLDAAGLDHALVARTEIVEQIGADGLRGARPEDEVAQAFDAFYRDIASRFAVDPDRVWAAGLSQTGFWAWELAHQRPDRFSGIAPMSAVSVQQQPYLANFLNVSVFVLHGDQDKVCPISQPRATTKVLEQLGVRVKMREIEGAGHDVKVWGRLADGLAWIAERPRERYPKRIAKALQTTRQPWCHWVRVDELTKPGSGESGAPAAASFEAEIAGQEVRITSKGIEHLTLALSSEMLELAQPVIVEWNGKKVHQRAVERDFATCARLAAEKVDWSATFEAAIEL